MINLSNDDIEKLSDETKIGLIKYGFSALNFNVRNSGETPFSSALWYAAMEEVNDSNGEN